MLKFYVMKRTEVVNIRYAKHAMFTSAVPAVVKTVISGILFGCCQA